MQGDPLSLAPFFWNRHDQCDLSGLLSYSLDTKLFLRENGRINDVM